MPRNLLLRTAAVAAVGVATSLVAAGEDHDTKTLSVGDPAPAIDIAHWIKGVEVEGRTMTPLTEFEEGKVYVLEFWATWCGPCKASMPHLSKLQEEYKDYDVTIIGVSDEALPKVVSFLFDTYPKDGKINHERTNYVLATDPDLSVKNDYFKAAGRTGIPASFIIGKDSKIEWIGHPMYMDDALGAVVRDTWDRDEFRAKMEREEAQRQMLRTAKKAGDWDTVLGIYEGQLTDNPDNLGLQLNIFNVLLLDANRPSDAYAVGHRLMETGWEEAGLLNAMAWTVADDKRVTKRDLGFALKAATQANELTKSEDPAILDTLARVYYEQGDLKNAVKYQRRAAEFAGDNRMGEGIREALEKYEREAK